MCQDLGSSPASMGASKSADAYGSLPGHDVEQADAEQAYVQARLEGHETSIRLPDECPERHRDDPARSHLFFDKDGQRLLNRPCVRLGYALYGHSDAGSCWERHCDRQLVSTGFGSVENLPPCYYHDTLKLMLVVYVDDFKLAGPKTNLAEGWKLIKDAVHMGELEAPGMFLGCDHTPFTI